MKLSLGHLKYANVPLEFDLTKPKRNGNILYVGGYFRAMEFYRRIAESIPPKTADFYLTIMQEKRREDWAWLRGHPNHVATLASKKDIEMRLPSSSDFDIIESEEDIFERPVFYFVDDLLAFYQAELCTTKVTVFSSHSQCAVFTAVDPLMTDFRLFHGWGKPLKEADEEPFMLARIPFNLWLFSPFEDTNDHHVTFDFGAIVPSMLRDNELLVWLNGQWDVLVRE
ncbi:MAG: hypothetical protein N2646_09095 [Bellilinea sp.]|nr:hypothetical protein [Bellilinea sp.]